MNKVTKKNLITSEFKVSRQKSVLIKYTTKQLRKYETTNMKVLQLECVKILEIYL